MSSKQTVDINKTQNEEHKIPCSKCVGKTHHKVLQSVDVAGSDNYDDWDFSFKYEYQIIQCQGCDSISFRKSYTDSDTYYEDEGEFIYFDTTEVYPSRIVGRQKLSESRFLPHNVQQIYSETHAALCSKQPILAVIGIRALIETVCKENNASGKDLEKRIDNLVTLGILTNQNAELLHSLRILGNEAAHEVKVQKEQILGLAMDVVEQLLKNVYILPALSAKLPKRKTSSNP